MKNTKYIAFSLLISFCFVTVIMQMAELKLADYWGRVCYKLSGYSFMEIDTKDKEGIPMRYYPGLGKVYDPQLIASEASRFYDTRIEPARQQAFLNLSQWLTVNVDSTGFIPQTYNYDAAGMTKPWYSAPTQAISLLAIAKRAGHLRDPVAFMQSRKMLTQLDRLSSPTGEGGIWFWEFGAGVYSLKGMMNTLISLSKYHKIVGDSLSAKLFKQGTVALAYKLPELTNKGYLEDKYHHRNPRSEHHELVNLLALVNQATPDSIFKPAIIRLRKAEHKFILMQILSSPRFGRIMGFLCTWAVVFAFVYLPLKPRRPHIQS